jgi:hypothetical protein
MAPLKQNVDSTAAEKWILFAGTAALSLQHQLTPTTMIEIAYLGSNIQGADSSTVRNVPLPGPGPIGPRRPIPALASFTSLRWDGYSLYHAGTIRAEKRLSRGISFNANYTFSKAIDDASDPGATTNEANLPQDVRDHHAERALASFHHTHRFVASGMYELPFGRVNRFSMRAELGRQYSAAGDLPLSPPLKATYRYRHR